MKKLRQRKLLIIDEIDYPRLVLEHFLMSNGYKVHTAQNGIEAVKHISTELPDLILISIRSRDCMGLSALKAFRSFFNLRLDLAQAAEPPIIILSAFGNSEITYDLMALGVSKVLFKPLNMQDLLNAIESSMEMDNKIPVSQHNKKILILDSEVRAQQLFMSILADEELDIDTVGSESELLGKIGEKIDLCIIDLSSLDSEIADLLKTIKETADNIYILTVGDSNYEVSLDNIEIMGIQGHFTKPISINIFRDEVDKLLNPQTENETKDAVKDEPEQSISDNEEEATDEPGMVTAQNTSDAES